MGMLRTEDIYNYVMKCLPYLLPFLILLVGGIVLFFISKKWDIKKRKFVRKQSILVVLLSLILGAAGIVFNPLYSPINLALTKIDGISEKTRAKGDKLIEEIAGEGIVLLKNEKQALPLTEKKVNVFGWASSNPVYGGSGSGGVDSSKATSLIKGIENAGIKTNEELTSFYTNYNDERITGSLDGNTDWTLPEPSVDKYEDSLLQNAKNFSDTAIIVIGRVGGEGDDLPSKMKDINYDTESEGAANPGDFTEEQSYLEMSKTEKEMVEMVTENFDNVIVVYNSSNPFELGFLDGNESIKGALLISGPGQQGFNALGKVLNGEVNPSGKLTDTFVYNLKETYYYNNIGDFKYDNIDEFKDTESGQAYDDVTFLNYTEGIYIGYKFYETAAAEGLIDYDEVVQYPFGYGLSYSNFSQKMGELKNDGQGNISVEVTVKNEGDTSGKEVVQLYYTPPYKNGGIEKSDVNLLDFGKTKMLEPNESETLIFEFKEEDMASYDSKINKSYVLENGVYNISIRKNSHEVIESKDLDLKEIEIFNDSNPRTSDDVAATNIFDYARGNVTYLSRKDKFANYEEATAAPKSYSMPDEVKEVFINNDNYDYSKYNDSNDKAPITGAKNNLVLADMTGLEYEDPKWDELLNKLTIDEMVTLSGKAGFSTIPIPSIEKISTSEIDGPSGLHSFFNKGQQGNSYTSTTLLASTWNKELSKKYGSIIAEEAAEISVNGWYGPAMNIHRSAFSGRNFEYFSEDATLSGLLAAEIVKETESNGLYSFLKHFAINDQEINRNKQLTVWIDEQAAREGYLKAFELPIKEGKSTAIMSAFNYIGHEYAGASSPLLQTLLRDEWGFRGMVLTDAALDGYNYINGDQTVRNGGDAILNPDLSGDTVIKDTESATSQLAMRTAAHNILYTVANSNAYVKGDTSQKLELWETLTYIGIGSLLVIIAVIEVVITRKYLQNLNCKIKLDD